MIIDLEKFETSFTRHSCQRSAICIAGAGVAGLVLATAVADAGLDVVLLEAGGRHGEDRSQEIYDADMAGTKHAGTTVGRFRVFGGSSTRWGGQLLPYTADVFSPDRELLSTEWPVSPSELEPFYRRIEDILGADHLPFSTDLYKALGMPVPAGFAENPDLSVRVSKWAPFPRRNLARTLGKKAIESTRIRVFLHANLTECLLAPDGSRVEAFLVRNYRGDRFRFEAQHYVMSTGTIETSRLLLASRSVCVQGVGNDHGRVGFGFHDHVTAPVAELNGSARNKLLSWLGPFFSRGTTHTARLEASASLRRRCDLLAVNAHITIEEPEGSAEFAARDLLRSMQRCDLRSAIRNNYRRLPAAALGMGRLVYNAGLRRRRAISPNALVELRIACEQRPCSQNRIRLAERARDSLGVLKAIVDWRVSAEEIRTLRCYALWLRAELDRLQAGAIDWNADVIQTAAGRFPPIRDTNHPMGGTVMGLHPATSVVDSNLKVHGISNIHIASCSTYPSGGSSNPTFTLIALTLRLAERLKQLANRSTGIAPSGRLVRA